MVACACGYYSQTHPAQSQLSTSRTEYLSLSMNIHLSEHILVPSLTINPHHILIELSKGFAHSSVFSEQMKAN